MGIILEDNQIFLCPECGSSHWGSTPLSDNTLERNCHGLGCHYTWHESKDSDHIHQKVIFPLENDFAYAECFQIDPEGKNVLFVYYPENIDPDSLESLGSVISDIQNRLDEWAKAPDNPIYVFCLPWDIRIKIEKSEG